MKYKLENSCPCGDYEFTIIYLSDNGPAEELYCPFCSAPVEDYIPDEEDED